MDTNNKQETLGYFLKRNNITNISVADLLKELQNNLFEANIIKLAIQNLLDNKLSTFDSAVGDWKCQTRTSMIIDLIQDTIFLHQTLPQELTNIDTLIFKNQCIINQINKFNATECQELRFKLKEISLQEYLKNHSLIYNPSEKITLLSLCFLTTLKNNIIPIFNHHQISVNKMKAFINIAKKYLCALSTNYEKSLMKTYSSPIEQKTMMQIEYKSVQHMTALYPGFKSIFKKMLLTEQPFIMNHLIFCTCGSIQNINPQIFIVKNNKFIPTSTLQNTNKAITTITTYQFPGSLETLQNILGVPHHELGIPKEYYKTCSCLNSIPQENIHTIETSIMAFFAQHPQFTNGAEIDFASLGLLDSDLKKEYDYLQTLKGFNRNDMSNFNIIHIYPSTIAEVMKQRQEQLPQMAVTSSVSFQQPIANPASLQNIYEAKRKI